MVQSESALFVERAGLARRDDAARALSGDTTTVSVVIPCFNAGKFIEKLLQNLQEQYSHERYEIVVVDGLSTDRTRAVISEFVVEHPGVSVRVVDNPARNIPAALNLGIAEARGEVIVRMDAHSIPPTNYVRRCVEVLSDPEISVVGMPIRTYRRTARALTWR